MGNDTVTNIIVSYDPAPKIATFAAMDRDAFYSGAIKTFATGNHFSQDFKSSPGDLFPSEIKTDTAAAALYASWNPWGRQKVTP